MSHNEHCIGEYEMHKECKSCLVKIACKKKFNKLMLVYRERLLDELPNRAKAKDYLQLQKIEAMRQRLADKIKRINNIKKELHKEKYNYTREKYKFFGVKEE